MEQHDGLPRLPSWPVLLGLVALFVALGLGAFGHSLSQGFAPIDDSFLVQQNLAVRGITPQSLRLAFTTYDPELYIPMTLVSFQADYLFAGLNPFVFHATNLLLHIINAMLVSWLLLLLTRRRWLSLFAGLLFAVHPLHTEAVVWIAGRKDLLSATFFLLSFILFLYARRGRRALYIASACSFVAALLAKVIAVTLVPILFLPDFLEQGMQWRRWSLRNKLPYALFALPFAVIALGGKARVLASSSPFQGVLLAGKSVLFYLGKMFLPVHLSVFYPVTETISITSPSLILCLMGLLTLLFLMFVLRKRAPMVSAGIFFFLCALAPTLLHYSRGESMFFAVDRYAYVPSIGILLVLVGILSALHSWITTWPREVPWVVSSVVLGVLLLLSMQQTRVWDSPESLFGNALKFYPASVDARVALASVQRTNGDTQGAFDTLRQGLTYGDDARLHFQVAYVYAATGDVAAAQEQLQEAIKLDPLNPDPVYALGTLAEQAGDRTNALTEYEHAAAMDDSFVAAHVSAGLLLLEQGQTDAAAEHFETALHWNPSSIDAHLAMARLCMSQQKTGEANEHLRAVLLLDPQNDEAQILLRQLFPSEKKPQ